MPWYDRVPLYIQYRDLSMYTLTYTRFSVIIVIPTTQNDVYLQRQNLFVCTFNLTILYLYIIQMIRRHSATCYLLWYYTYHVLLRPAYVSLMTSSVNNALHPALWHTLIIEYRCAVVRGTARNASVGSRHHRFLLLYFSGFETRL